MSALNAALLIVNSSSIMTSSSAYNICMAFGVSCIPCVCLCFAGWLFYRTPTVSRRALPRAYVLTMQVTHVRLLPPQSRHSFMYPTLSLLVSLDALDSGSLDIPVHLIGSWLQLHLFRYGSRFGTLLGLRSDGFLSSGRGETSTRRKLDEVLRVREKLGGQSGDAAKHVKDAWMLTMPSILGFEGINPLTVYFCYQGDGQVVGVVLEVHNTFGEGHIYVLEMGKDEDPMPPAGYDHQWTFPRTFFVSPFNDRTGYYTVAIKLPSHVPFPVSDGEKHGTGTMNPSVRIYLHEETLSSSDPDSNSQLYPGPLKLFALLRPTSARVLTSHTLLGAMATTPLSLLLTLLRIWKEATVLHYKKGLDMVGKPEAIPSSVRTRVGEGDDHRCSCFGLGTKDRTATSTEPQAASEQSGGIIYRSPTLLERYARWRLFAFLRYRLRSLRKFMERDVRIMLIPADPSVPVMAFWLDGGPVMPGTGRVALQATNYCTSKTIHGDIIQSEENAGCTRNANEKNINSGGIRNHDGTLRILYVTPKFFALLLTAPNAELALLLGADGETEGQEIFKVSDDVLFMDVFGSRINGSREDESVSAENTRNSWLCTLTQNIRLLAVPRTLLRSLGSHGRYLRPTHPLEALRSSTSIRIIDLLVVFALILSEWVEEYIYKVAGVRFVEGTEPWRSARWARITRSKGRTMASWKDE
ncbi:hypothetical protein F5I97DRAFT_1931782 [Phlebopus sp. FC_14]|nr:hypothetical protein F5I97DRAFT_1931782 [Phlebopus sp. FC_14]